VGAKWAKNLMGGAGGGPIFLPPKGQFLKPPPKKGVRFKEKKGNFRCNLGKKGPWAFTPMNFSRGAGTIFATGGAAPGVSCWANCLLILPSNGLKIRFLP